MCDEYATCNNTWGNYTCECNDGFQGDGFECNDIDECNVGTLASGYLLFTKILGGVKFHDPDFTRSAKRSKLKYRHFQNLVHTELGYPIPRHNHLRF